MTQPPDPVPGLAASGSVAGDSVAGDSAAGDTAARDSAAGDFSAGLAGPTISRVWDLRKRAEQRGVWQRPVLGVLVAAGFAVIANPDLLPGGTPVAVGTFVLMMAVVIAGAVVWTRRSSIRGHSGNVDVPETPRRQWWRSPALAGPAVYTTVFLGNLIGVFDHWPVVIGCAVVAGFGFALTIPRYETADHIHGARLENPPVLSADAEAALVGGELTPDVLELLVLQHHTVERRISWCADVLGTDEADIRDRIARGRRWLELPATEVHDPANANWARLSAAGREALGYL